MIDALKSEEALALLKSDNRADQTNFINKLKTQVAGIEKMDAMLLDSKYLTYREECGKFAEYKCRCTFDADIDDAEAKTAAIGEG